MWAAAEGWRVQFEFRFPDCVHVSYSCIVEKWLESRVNSMWCCPYFSVSRGSDRGRTYVCAGRAKVRNKWYRNRDCTRHCTCLEARVGSCACNAALVRRWHTTVACLLPAECAFSASSASTVNLQQKARSYSQYTVCFQNTFAEHSSCYNPNPKTVHSLLRAALDTHSSCVQSQLHCLSY